MDYTKAYTFFAKKQPKSGWNNLLFGAVCQLIPIVGPIVFYGYRIDVARDIEDDPDMMYHRDFDFNKFGEYLGKGAWVFLVQLVAAMAALTVAAALAFLVYAVSSGLPPQDRFLVSVFTGYGLYFVCLFLVIPIIWAIECHYAMAGRFRIGEAVAFAGKFIPLMWGNLLVTVILYFFASTVVGLVGYIMCCVGLYAAIPIIAMAEGHLILQLYRRYLEKGGEPIRRFGADEDDDEGN